MRLFVRAIKKYWLFRGRDSWGQYWGFVAETGAIYVLLLLAGAALCDVPYVTAASEIIVSVMVAGQLMMIPPLFAATIRRLHDRGASGNRLFLLFLPLIHFVVPLDLLLPGNRGPNRYGLDPRRPSPPITTIEEIDAMNRADLYHEFAVDVTPFELLRGYRAPDPLDGLTAAVLDTGWATETTARPIASRLWTYALDATEPAALLAAFDAQLDWRESEGLWCLHGVNRDGNAWETEHYEAKSESAALEAAAESLRAYHYNRT